MTQDQYDQLADALSIAWAAETEFRKTHPRKKFTCSIRGVFMLELMDTFGIIDPEFDAKRFFSRVRSEPK